MDPPVPGQDMDGGSAYGSVSPALLRHRKQRGGSAAKGKVFAVLVSATVLVAVWQVSSSSSSAPTLSLSTDSDDVWGSDTARASSSLSARAMDEKSPYDGGRAVDSVQPAVKFEQLGLTAPKWFMKMSSAPRRLASRSDARRSELAAGRYTSRSAQEVNFAAFDGPSPAAFRAWQKAKESAIKSWHDSSQDTSKTKLEVLSVFTSCVMH